MLLIGSYLNLMLYTLELVAVYLYFSNERSKRDHPLIMFAVCFTLLTDTLASFAVCADVFAVRAYYHSTPFIITFRRDLDLCLVLGSANIQIYLPLRPSSLMPILREYVENFCSSMVPYLMDHLEQSWSIRCSNIYGVALLEAVSHIDPTSIPTWKKETPELEYLTVHQIIPLASSSFF